MKKINFMLMLTLLIGFANLLNAQQLTGNPIMGGADPELHYFNNKYYIYKTSSGGNKFHTYSSVDMVDWKDEGVIFNLATQCDWGKTNGWAPCMVFKNNKYYFYYAAIGKIGVAVGNTPIGPFTDIGAPLIGTDPFTDDIIDAMVFTDDDGQTYIYYGGSGKSKMGARRLNADMISIKGTAIDATPPHYTEGPYLVKRNGIYYMMYSNGNYRNASYNVRYSTSNTPLGPWTYQDVILQSNDEDLGPGHHGVLKMGDCDEYYMIYHRYEDSLGGSRQLAIDRMYFNSAGLIDKVNMTNYGVAARVPDNSCATKAIVSGGIYKLTHKGTTKCLDVLNNSAAAGANVQQYTDNGNDAQRWVITQEADGYYKIKHKGTNQCLEVVNNSSATKANVQQNTDNGSDAQRWKIEAMSDGYLKITHKGTNQCLNVDNNSNQNNANVNQSTDNGTDAQRWAFDLIEAPVVTSGLYRLTHKGTTQCLDINSTQAGVSAKQWTDMGNVNRQLWYIALASDGYYQIKHKGTNNLCLDVGNNSSASGANVQQWTDLDNAAQRWSIELQADGYFKLTHKGTTQCLNVDNNSAAPGAYVNQYADNGTDAQRWKLDLVPDVDPIVGTGTGLAGNYFNGINFDAPVYTATDAIINFDWAAGSPNALVNNDQFSARWTGLVQAEYTGEYTFYINSDNGSKLWVDGQLIIDNWVDAVGENSGKITLTAGQKYEIKLEYFEKTGSASVKLEWESFMQPREVVPQKQLYANTLPTLSITSPANKQVFVSPAAIAIAVTATDVSGSILKVEFYNGSAKLGEDLTSPYTYNWTGVAKGTYTITARAFDNRNAVTVSTAVSVTVNDPVVTDITDASITSGLTVSPNPTEGNLYINTSADLSAAHISIFDSQGKLLSKPALHGHVVSVNDLQPGLYIIEISNLNDKVVQRFIKK